MIAQRSHPAVKRLRDLRDGRDKSLLFIEGVRLAEELLTSPLRPVSFFFSSTLKTSTPLLARLENAGASGECLSPEVMAFASDLDSPPGLIILAEKPTPWRPATAGPPRLIVVLDGVQNPANAGAIVRTAEAAGVEAVLSSTGGADLLAPKALRASAGGAFRLPLGGGKSSGEWRDLLKTGGTCVAADAQGEAPHTAFDWKRPTVLFIGGEKGLSEPLSDLPKVRIPLSPPVESLNVAVATGILLFEAARRRAV